MFNNYKYLLLVNELPFSYFHYNFTTFMQGSRFVSRGWGSKGQRCGCKNTLTLNPALLKAFNRVSINNDILRISISVLWCMYKHSFEEFFFFALWKTTKLLSSSPPANMYTLFVIHVHVSLAYNKHIYHSPSSQSSPFQPAGHLQM